MRISSESDVYVYRVAGINDRVEIWLVMGSWTGLRSVQIDQYSSKLRRLGLGHP